ncbi:MAG: hypothetical protein RLZZ04_3305, partial [Cyanobacteriota bacterium]
MRSIKTIIDTAMVFSPIQPNAKLERVIPSWVVDNRRFPVVYSSSPLSYSFSEANQDKCVVIINAKPGVQVEFENIILKGGYALHRITFDAQQVVRALGKAAPSRLWSARCGRWRLA